MRFQYFAFTPLFLHLLFPTVFFEGKNLKSYKMELENLLSHGRLVDACRQYQVSVGISLSDFCHSTRCTCPFPNIRHLPLKFCSCYCFCNV